MLEKAFELAVVFSAVDQMTGPISRMATQLGILDEKTKATQQRLNEFKNMTFIGGAITAVGIGLAHVMEDGVRQAGDFLTKSTMIKDAVGATADQMDRINKTIRDSSGKGIYSVSQTQDFAKSLATSGLDPDQLNSTLPIFTQFAEVQQLGKGSDPAEAIKRAVEGAHTVGAYNPADLSAFLDKYNKATFLQPGDSTQFADTFKYVASRTSGMKVSTDDMLMMSSLANRVGLAGSMGGTESADMILRTIPGLMSGSGKKDSKQTAALKELGIADTIYDKNGQFKGVANLVEQLQKSGNKFNPEQFAKLAHDAFGQQGMGMAEILASPRGKEQLDALVKQMKDMKSIGQMQEDLNKTPEGQMLQLKTNIENLKLDVWLQLAKILNPIFMWLNKIVSKVQDFSAANPWIAKLSAELLTLLTATVLILGPLLTLVGVIGYLKAAQTVEKSFQMLKLAFTGIFSTTGLIVIGIMALVAGLIYLWNTNESFRKAVITAWTAIYAWFQQFMPQIQVIGTTTFNTIKNVVMAVYDVFSGLLIPIIKALWDLVSPTFPLIASVISAAFKVVLQIVEAVALAFERITSAIKTAVDWLVKWANTKPDPKTLQLTTSAKAGVSIGQNANGTDNWRGGLTWVGERGPELVNLPKGSQVIPNHKTGSYLDDLRSPSQQNNMASTANTSNENTSSGDVHFHGDIIINAQPSQSPRELAQQVYQELGRMMKNKSYSRATTATSMW